MLDHRTLWWLENLVTPVFLAESNLNFKTRCTLKRLSGALTSPTTSSGPPETWASIGAHIACWTLCTKPTAMTWRHLAAQEATQAEDRGPWAPGYLWGGNNSACCWCSPQEHWGPLRNAGFLEPSQKALLQRYRKTRLNWGDLPNQFPVSHISGWAALLQPNQHSKSRSGSTNKYSKSQLLNMSYGRLPIKKIIIIKT